MMTHLQDLDLVTETYIDLKNRENLREHVESLHMSPKLLEPNSSFVHEKIEEISFNQLNVLNNHKKPGTGCSETINLSNASFEKELFGISGDNDLEPSKVLRDRIASFQVQKPFQCLSCDARFKLKDSLKRHQKLKHVDQMINQATEKITNEKSNPVGSAQEIIMTNNMSNGLNDSIFHGNVKLPNIVLKPKTEKERKWNCPTCNTDFQSRRILRNHIAFVHRGQKPFT